MSAAPIAGKVSAAQLETVARAMFLATMPESFKAEYADGSTGIWDADEDWQINRPTYLKLAAAAVAALNLEIEK